MESNMIGAYGPWASGLSGQGPARLSFRQPRFQAAVIAVAMLLHHRVDLVADLGDLPPAEILVAAMIMQPEHDGESAPCAGWFQEDRLRRRSIRELPGQVLNMQTVVVQLVLDLSFGNSA